MIPQFSIYRHAIARRRCAAQRTRQNPSPTAAFNLIGHECDERRHHHGEPLEHQRRHLKADGLATTSGENREDISTQQNVTHDRTLSRTEIRVAEMLLQQEPGAGEEFHGQSIRLLGV